MLAAFAFSCGDGGTRSSERDEGTDNMENRQPVEPDTTTTNDYRMDETESDTTSTYDQDQGPMRDEGNTQSSQDSL